MRKNHEQLIPVLRTIIYKLGWRHIEGYTRNYYANSEGDIFSVNKPTGKLRQLKPHLNKRWGYNTVELKCLDEKYRKKRVNRLIAEAFISNDDPKNKTDVHHKNHNRADDRACNLEWMTHQENCRHRKGKTQGK